MKPSVSRTLLAGVAGGATFWAATFLTFVLVGSGPLFDPAVQSPKLIAVWTELEPLPLFATAPHMVLLEYVLFATGYAFLLRSVAAAWPAGAWARTWRLATVIWGLSCAFFELLGPVNLLGEPPGLVALELGFWAVAALAESLVVVFLLRHPRREELVAPAVLTRESRPGGPAAEVAGQARAGGSRSKSAAPLGLSVRPDLQSLPVPPRATVSVGAAAVGATLKLLGPIRGGRPARHPSDCML